MKKTLCIIASVAALAWSCAAAPKIQQSAVQSPIPSKWTARAALPDSSAVQADTTLSLWWTRFNDPQLDSLVTRALTHNYNLKIAAGRLHAARAQAKIAGAPLYPQVNLGFNSSKRRQNFIGLPIPGSGGVLSTTSTSYGLSADLSWEIDLWRRLSAGKSAALADFQAAQADLYGARLSLVAQTSRAWFTAIEARRQLELARATLENLRLVNAQIQSRYERGIRSSLDLRLSLSNVATTEAVVVQRQQGFDSTIRQLEILLGRYPAAEMAVGSDLPAMPGPVPAGLPANLIARRPDLVIAERRVAASSARVSEAKRAQYPRISLTSSAGTTSNQLTNLLKGDFFVWSLAGNLLQPLFQGGRLRAGVELARANHEQTLAGFAEQALRAYGEVESALAAETFLAAQERALQVATEQAVAARELAETRYASGLSDVITMLEAQRRAFDAEGQYITVRRQRLESRVNLYLALGGDFEIESLKD